MRLNYKRLRNPVRESIRGGRKVFTTSDGKWFYTESKAIAHDNKGIKPASGNARSRIIPFGSRTFNEPVVKGEAEIFDERSGAGNYENSPSEYALMEFAHDKNRAEIERGEEEIRFVGYSITKKKGELPQITIHSA